MTLPSGTSTANAGDRDYAGADVFAQAVVNEATSTQTLPNGDAGERGWRAGWPRIEGSGMAAWRSGRRARGGDVAARILVDYEIPATKHLTVGPRIMPFMFWNENNQGDNDIYAAGLGVVLRGYFKKDEYRGFYGELGLMGIAQTDKFEGNSGTFNFEEEIGIGYVFNSDWSASLKVGHFSNAGFADDNAGVNWAALGVGYSFRR